LSGYPQVPEGGQVNLIHVDVPTLLRTTTPQFLYLRAPGI